MTKIAFFLQALVAIKCCWQAHRGFIGPGPSVTRMRGFFYLGVYQYFVSRNQIVGRRPNAPLNSLASLYPNFSKHLAKFVHGQVKKETETACKNLATCKPQVREQMEKKFSRAKTIMEPKKKQERTRL